MSKAPLPPAGGVGGGPTPSSLRGSSPPAGGRGDVSDRDLVRLYWPADLRPAFDALLSLEDSLLEVAASSTQPALGAIRMAWWRDALRRLDDHPPPPEPRLQACARELLPRGVTGAALAAIAEGYATLFDETPDAALIDSAGSALFSCGAILLGASDPRLADAGAAHALGRVRRLGLLADAPPPPELAGHRFARPLRPLTALARLGIRDLTRAPEPEATPARAAALLSHRLFGTVA
ncbi:hypothetical protein [Sphingomonas mesophila]|uniref:hypothetical protein n=1 Tax=Sphingomonas mesophila TaxID=2303576 RepID=UPI000E5790A5|nr:hypothetical protein [Sphingomonas mesophila]